MHFDRFSATCVYFRGVLLARGDFGVFGGTKFEIKLRSLFFQNICFFLQLIMFMALGVKNGLKNVKNGILLNPKFLIKIYCIFTSF